MKVSFVILGALLVTCSLACKKRTFGDGEIKSSAQSQPQTAMEWCTALQSYKIQDASKVDAIQGIMSSLFVTPAFVNDCQVIAAHMEGATYVTANLPYFTIKDLTPFAALKNVEALSLRGNKITAKDLAALKQLPKLRWIWLHGNPVSKADCAQVPQVPANQCFTDDSKAVREDYDSSAGQVAQNLLPIGRSIEPADGVTQSFQDEFGLAHTCQFKIEQRGTNLVTTNFNTKNLNPSSEVLRGPDEIDFGSMSEVKIVKVKNFNFMAKKHVFVRVEGTSHTLRVVYEVASKKLVFASRERKVFGRATQFFCIDKDYTLSGFSEPQIWADNGKFAITGIGGETLL